MRKESDLTTLKLKRRGILPGLQGQVPRRGQSKKATLWTPEPHYYQDSSHLS
jgi:hypothetical protein